MGERRVSGAVGVLGGAFNPPHLGHMLLAQAAIEDLGLERLILVPTGIAPHKVIEPEPGPGVRLELARAAVAGEEGIEVSAMEVEDTGPSFSFRTLERLVERLPESELILVLGADAAAGLPAWRRPERVVALARVAVAERPGAGAAGAVAALRRLGAGDRVERVGMPQVGISSTMVRERVAAGRSIRWLVPAPVVELIASRGLYGAPDGGGGG